MKRYDGTIVYLRSELIELFGYELFTELNSTLEMGHACTRPHVYGSELVYLHRGFSKKAKNALYDALK